MHLHFKYKALLFAVFAKFAFCCEFVKNLEINFEISQSGNGLKRVINVELQGSSKVRLPDCRLMYQFGIPKTMYMDVYSVNRTALEHDLVSMQTFNMEALSRDSKAYTVNFVRRNPYLGTFVIRDSFSFPVHLRYPTATDDGMFKTRIHIPKIGLDCTGLSAELLKGCDKVRHSKDDRLEPRSKSWIDCKVVAKEPEFDLATGIRQHTNFVLITTFFAVFGCILLSANII